jgi:hypothetical protein
VDGKYVTRYLFPIAKRALTELQDFIQEKPSLQSRLKVLADIVQAYPFEETYMPTLRETTREFECNLRANLLGQLYEKFIDDDAIICADVVEQHTRLMVIDKGFMTDPNTRPKTYFIDPTWGMEWQRDEQQVRTPNSDINTDNRVKLINDDGFVDTIINAYKSDPLNFNINVHLSKSQYPYTEKYHSISDYRTGTESGIWNNLGYMAKNKETSRICYEKAVELNPTYAMAWRNIAAVTTDPIQRNFVLRKAHELDPENNALP